MADDTIHGMAPNGVSHFVAEDKRNLIRVESTQFDKRLGDEDESSRQGKGIRLGILDRLKNEPTMLVGHAISQTLTYTT